MPSTVVVYVTRDGHSRAIAESLGKKLGAEVHEILDLVKRKGAIAYLNSGRQASIKAATPIRDPDIDLSAFDTVVIAEPVWASAICPPVRSWVRAHAKELAGKRLAVIASCIVATKEVVRAAFESEFSAELGPLAACATVSEKADETLRASAIEAFASELTRA